MTRRLLRPCVYSCQTVAASSSPLMLRKLKKSPGVEREQVHLHPRALAVGRRRHVGVVDVVAVRAAVAGGVGAVVGVDLDRVVLLAGAVAAEAVGVVGEADRRAGEVVVEDVDEVERLGGGLLAVDLPRVGIGRVPGAARGLADRRHPAAGGGGVNTQASSWPGGCGELGERIEEVVAGRRVHELGRLGDVVVVDVRVDVRERAVELVAPGASQPSGGEVDVARLRCAAAFAGVRVVLGARVVREHGRRRRTWSGSGGRARRRWWRRRPRRSRPSSRLVGHVPGEPGAVGGAEQHQPGEVAAGERRHAARPLGHRTRPSTGPLHADVGAAAPAAPPRRRPRGRIEATLGSASGEPETESIAPGAVERDPQAVVERGDAAVALLEAQVGEPVARRRRPLGELQARRPRRPRARARRGGPRPSHARSPPGRPPPGRSACRRGAGSAAACR